MSSGKANLKGSVNNNNSIGSIKDIENMMSLTTTMPIPSFNHKNGKYCRPFSGMKYKPAAIA